LTEKEVERLIEAARKRGRNGPRDAAAQGLTAQLFANGESPEEEIEA